MSVVIEKVNTYSGMSHWRDLFVAPEGLRFLIVVGGPGTGKSQMFTRRMPKGSLYVSGALSAVHFYAQLYGHTDAPILVDDVDSLFRDKASVNLLKSLGNTDDEKLLCWGKQNAQLRADGVPDRFVTTSRLCILANTLTSIEANLEAVFSRAIIVNFEPSVPEIHHEVDRWFEDREVFEFIGQHLSLVRRPSMRTYVIASDLRRSGGDWRGWLLRQWTAEDLSLGKVAEIMNDLSLMTAADRVKRFAEMGGGSRPTFMRKQALWRKLMGLDNRDVA